MGLIDALAGRIEHFNNTAVPVLNSIFARIQKLSDEQEKQLFSRTLVIAQLSIDLFFKPGQGPAIKDVKKYNKHDFEQLHALFMIWVFYDFANAGAIKRSEIKSRIGSILTVSEDEVAHYLEQLNHGSETPVGLEKLWNEVVSVIHTMPNTPENYFVFSREFSRICKGVFQQTDAS